MTLIAKEYGLKDRSSVYRHAHALDLFPKRQRNVRAALERIIERAYEVEVNAAAVVSAVCTYASINSFGQWVERSEQVNLSMVPLICSYSPNSRDIHETDVGKRGWDLFQTRNLLFPVISIPFSSSSPGFGAAMNLLAIPYSATPVTRAR